MGVPDRAAREWAVADIEGLKQIAEPADRKLPLAIMAFNMSDNRPYRAKLQELAPDIAAEVRDVGVHEVEQGTGLLHDHRTRSDREQREKDELTRLSSGLDARMAKANLSELGWRDRGDLGSVMEDLERLAAKNWEKAAALWDKYRPDDQDKPRFIDGDDKDPRPTMDLAKIKTPSALESDVPKDEDDQTTASQARNAAKAAALREALRSRYHVTNDKYYFRNGNNDLAFEDKGKHLATEHDDPQVAKSMLDLAAAKEWTSIKVKGTKEFKRQVWLEASLRGIEVQGHRPSERDLQQLADLRGKDAPRPTNEIIREEPRERTPEHREAGRQPVHSPIDKALESEAPAHSLSKQQLLAIDTLKAILRSRGDSDIAVEMAGAVAAERFQRPRVYVGKLIEHGAAPYENNPDNDDNYYVKLQTPSGARTVWGVDLPRALEHGEVKKGDDIALVYQGKKPVTVKSKELDELGEPTGKMVEIQTERNTWDANKLDVFKDLARTRLQKDAQLSDKAERSQPVINVYDNAAPRKTERESLPDDVGRFKQKEHTLPR